MPPKPQVLEASSQAKKVLSPKMSELRNMFEDTSPSLKSRASLNSIKSQLKRHVSRDLEDSGEGGPLTGRDKKIEGLESASPSAGKEPPKESKDGNEQTLPEQESDFELGKTAQVNDTVSRASSLSKRSNQEVPSPSGDEESVPGKDEVEDPINRDKKSSNPRPQPSTSTQSFDFVSKIHDSPDISTDGDPSLIWVGQPEESSDTVETKASHSFDSDVKSLGNSENGLDNEEHHESNSNSISDTEFEPVVAKNMTSSLKIEPVSSDATPKADVLNTSYEHDNNALEGEKSAWGEVKDVLSPGITSNEPSSPNDQIIKTLAPSPVEKTSIGNTSNKEVFSEKDTTSSPISPISPSLGNRDNFVLSEIDTSPAFDNFPSFLPLVESPWKDESGLGSNKNLELDRGLNADSVGEAVSEVLTARDNEEATNESDKNGGVTGPENASSDSPLDENAKGLSLEPENSGLVEKEADETYSSLDDDVLEPEQKTTEAQLDVEIKPKTETEPVTETESVLRAAREGPHSIEQSAAECPKSAEETESNAKELNPEAEERSEPEESRSGAEINIESEAKIKSQSEAENEVNPRESEEFITDPTANLSPNKEPDTEILQSQTEAEQDSQDDLDDMFEEVTKPKDLSDKAFMKLEKETRKEEIPREGGDSEAEESGTTIPAVGTETYNQEDMEPQTEIGQKIEEEPNIQTNPVPLLESFDEVPLSKSLETLTQTLGQEDPKEASSQAEFDFETSQTTNSEAISDGSERSHKVLAAAATISATGAAANIGKTPVEAAKNAAILPKISTRPVKKPPPASPPSFSPLASLTTNTNFKLRAFANRSAFANRTLATKEAPSPTFSSMSLPVSALLPASEPLAGSHAYGLLTPPVGYASLPQQAAPMSPKTRDRVTGELKEMVSARRLKPVVLLDMPLPFQPLNRTRFPNTVKLDPSKSIVFAVALVDFNHSRGPEIEYWVDENGSIDIEELPQSLEKLTSMWPVLPFQALPDGSHEFEETFSYFNVLYDEKNGKTLNSICDSSGYPGLEEWSMARKNTEEKDLLRFNENVTTLWGILCVHQIAAEDLQVKLHNVTRTSVQKAIVVLCRQPIFGQLKDKLSIITKLFFLQKDFSDRLLLGILYENLCNLYAPDEARIAQERSSVLAHSDVNVNEGISSTLKESDFYVGLTVKEFIHQYKRQALSIFKAMLLEKKVLFFSKNIERLCSMQLALVALVPNLVTTLQDCGLPYLNFGEMNATKQVNMKTLSRYLMLRFLGLPLQPFGLGGVFNPYTPLQQLDDILRHDKITHYVIGLLNDLLLAQKARYSDVFVNLDTGTMEIVSQDLVPSLALLNHDKKFIDLVVKNVDKYQFSSNDGIEETLFAGSTDYIAGHFEEYLLGLLLAAKYEKFLHRMGFKVLFDGEYGPVGTPRVASPLMLVPGVELDNIDRFGYEFVRNWLKTENYKAFDRLTDNEIFYVFEPHHVAATEEFQKEQEEFDKSGGRNNLLEGFNILRQNVQNRLQKAPLPGFSGEPSASISNALQIGGLGGDSSSVHSFASNDRGSMKYAAMDLGSFSLDDLTTLNLINDEIEMSNPINMKKVEKEKKGWWGWGRN